MRVPYKIQPFSKPYPAFTDKKEMWVPVLTVALVDNHRKTARFEAIVDSGSFSSLFHSDLAQALGIHLESGIEGPLSGVIGGAEGKIYYHKVKLLLPGDMIAITAGFSRDLSVGGILGREGFFEHHVVTFNPECNPPGLELQRVRRA